MTAFHVRRDKGALFQCVQGPPGERFSRKQLQAPVIDRVIPLSEGCSAYAQVARGEAGGRLVLAP
jgi:hypothetical protein